jgi:hypothetical protein
VDGDTVSGTLRNVDNVGWADWCLTILPDGRLALIDLLGADIVVTPAMDIKVLSARWTRRESWPLTSTRARWPTSSCWPAGRSGPRPRGRCAGLRAVGRSVSTWPCKYDRQSRHWRQLAAGKRLRPAAERFRLEARTWLSEYWTDERRARWPRSRPRRCTARTGWVINGQKIWTTAYWGQYMFVAARADPDAQPQHKGISVFIVPIDAPGLQIRPTATMYSGPFERGR